MKPRTIFIYDLRFTNDLRLIEILSIYILFILPLYILYLCTLSYKMYTIKRSTYLRLQNTFFILRHFRKQYTFGICISSYKNKFFSSRLTFGNVLKMFLYCLYFIMCFYKIILDVFRMLSIVK